MPQDAACIWKLQFGKFYACIKLQTILKNKKLLQKKYKKKKEFKCVSVRINKLGQQNNSCSTSSSTSNVKQKSSNWYI